MEIIIRMEEKENLTVGAALREMANDYWVQTWLPKLIESAKKGCTTRKEFFPEQVSSNTLETVKKTFAKMGISVEYQWWLSKRNWIVTFSWG